MRKGPLGGRRLRLIFKSLMTEGPTDRTWGLHIHSSWVSVIENWMESVSVNAVFCSGLQFYMGLRHREAQARKRSGVNERSRGRSVKGVPLR